MKKTKRIIAWTGIIVLAGLYLSTIILALIGTDTARQWLKASVICTLGFPALLYGYQLIYRALKDRADAAGGAQRQEPSIREVIQKSKADGHP